MLVRNSNVGHAKSACSRLLKESSDSTFRVLGVNIEVIRDDRCKTREKLD